MKTQAIKIFPLGESALTVSFGNEISPQTNVKVLNLARRIQTNPFAGFIETLPAYSSLTIFYDVGTVRKKFSQFATAFDAVKHLANKALQDLDESSVEESRLIEIPVDFSSEFALDLVFVAAENHISPENVIEIFTARTYRVYMLGFLPGFAYMGEVDERIATARKSSPRSFVPQGSIGIAGRQTGIYSLASPGGWQIIGKTNVELFTPNDSASPSLLETGDDVKFYAVDL